MSTLLAPVEQVTCTDYACLNALSDESLCDCSTCFGAGHGHAHRATRQAARDTIRARIQRAGGNPFALMTDLDDDDEEW